MKIYKVSWSVRILYIIFSLFLLFCIAIIIIGKEASILIRLLTPFAIIFAVAGTWTIFNFKVVIDQESIEFIIHDIFALLLRKGSAKVKLSLKWNEIRSLESHYVLFPESPIIILRPLPNIPKKKIEFMMFGMSIELLADILSHLPSNTGIHLYTRLKRQLEGKQTWFFKKQEWDNTGVNNIKYNPRMYTKRKIIIIAILLTLMVIGGFLFSLFIWK